MTKLGELLKSEREKRGLSLHEIGMNLKINPKILKAIEDGDEPNLPAKTFLRGFVKSYAQYLRLNADEALQMFQEEYGSARVTPPTPSSLQATQPTVQPQGVPRYESSLKRPEDSALPVANNNRIYTILFAILLLTLIAFVAKMMDKYQKESRDAKTEVVSTVETSTTTTTTSTLPESTSAATPVTTTDSTTTTTLTTPATTLPVVTTTLKAAPITPIPTTTTTTTTLRAAPTTTLKPVVTTTTLRPAVTTTTLRAAVSVVATTTTTTSSTTTTLKAATTEVIVEALNRVTIRFTLNAGQKWESLELNPDQVHTFRSKSGVRLEVSDGGAVNVIINGRDRGVPGVIGKPLKLAYP
jgi:cytoskeleton protein RodZ